MTVSIPRVVSELLDPDWTRALAARLALKARRLLLSAADAVVPAQLVLFEQAVGIARTELLHAVARLAIADALADGPRTAADLARMAAVDARALARALRALASDGVFRFRRDGRVENTRISAALRSTAAASMRPFLEYFGSRANVEAWADFGTTLRTGRSAFRRVHGRTVWEWFADDASDAETFSAALARLAERDAAAIARSYPFQRFGRICDVAGGEGAILASILERAPAACGVLLERPDVVDRARTLLARRGLGNRVECRVGDFFEAVPRGCDAYLLKDVLHDWDDRAALRILRACHRASRPGTVLLVVEMLLEAAEAESPGAYVDLQMLTVTEQGRQRSRAEMVALLERAGWAIREVRRVPGLLSMMVATRPRTAPGRRPGKAATIHANVSLAAATADLAPHLGAVQLDPAHVRVGGDAVPGRLRPVRRRRKRDTGRRRRGERPRAQPGQGHAARHDRWSRVRGGPRD